MRPDSEHLSIGDTLYVFGGKSQAWQVPSVSISDTEDGDRPNGIRFTGIGIRAGFSGSALVDSKGQLAAIHLGTVESDANFGHAQLMANAYGALTRLGVTLNMLNLERTPVSDKSRPPASATERSGGLPSIGQPHPIRAPGSGAVAMDPANFAAIHVIAHKRQEKWSLYVSAAQGGLHRDTSLQVVVIDATDHLKPLPVSKKTVMYNTFTEELLDEIGKGVVVCYTAIDDSARGQALRMTSWFAVEVQGNRTSFVPLRPATLTRASDAPCQ